MSAYLHELELMEEALKKLEVCRANQQEAITQFEEALKILDKEGMDEARVALLRARTESLQEVKRLEDQQEIAQTRLEGLKARMKKVDPVRVQEWSKQKQEALSELLEAGRLLLQSKIDAQDSLEMELTFAETCETHFDFTVYAGEDGDPKYSESYKVEDLAASYLAHKNS